MPLLSVPTVPSTRSGFFNLTTCLAACVLLSVSSHAASLLSTVPVGKTPGEIVVNPTAHLVYVVNQGSNSVSVLDSETLAVKKVINVGSRPTGIAVNPATNLVYVANAGSGSITAISGTAAVGSKSVGGTPAALVLDSVLNQLYVMDTSRKQIEVFNASNGTLLATLSTTLTPVAMALNIATHGVFVACTGTAGSVVVIDGTHNQIAITVPVASGTTSISVDPVTNVAVLVSPTANLFTIIDAANGYAVQTENGEIGAKPFATAFNDGDGLFFEADNGDGNIFFADGTGINHLGNAFFVPMQGAFGLTTNPTTNQMIVLYGKTDVAELIDLLNPLFSQNYHQLTAGLYVAGVVFDPLTNRLFVSNSSDGTVSVFDISPRELVDAYEGQLGGSNIDYNYVDANPATGNVYTLRLNNLYAVNESAAGAGDNGQQQNTAGVTDIPLGSFYSGAVAVNSATNKIYAGDSVGFFYSVDGQSDVATLITSVPSTADIRGLAVDYATNEILAWDYANDNLYILDSTTNNLLKTVPLVSSGATIIQVDSAKNLAYVALSNSVYVIDPAAGTVVTTVPLSSQVLGAAFNPATQRLYVTAARDIFVIDTSTNTLVTDISLPSYVVVSVGVNPVSGNYYVGVNGSAYHILEYSGATNALVFDFSSVAYPAITGVADIKANPLTDTVYVGSDSGTSTSVVVAIDERSGSLSAIAPLFDIAAHALAMDLGSGLLAAGGYSYTNLFFPSSDLSGDLSVPILVVDTGVPDSQTIATKPIFRTRNTQPSFTISATSQFGNSSSDLVPRHAFYQVDGWQGTWKAVTLTPKQGTQTSTAKIKLPTLSTGRHILYVYASVGDVATIQAGLPAGNSVGNSPVISPVSSVVFTVER